MVTIISGTNRKNSNSYKIALHYQEMLKQKGEESSIVDLEKLPEDFLFSALYENNGKNESFRPTMELMKECQKFVFIVPEYNGSFPGVLKLFIDALEFPGTLRNKKGALVGLSAGIQGSALAMSHLTDILNYLGMHVLAQKPKLIGVNKKMSGNTITDETSLKFMEEQIDALLVF